MTNTDIIKAAFRVWGRVVYQKTSLSLVAAELGVTKTALYRHFRSKHSLMEGMYDYFFDDLAAATRPEYERALAAPDTARRYVILARTLAAYFCGNPEMFVFSLVQVYGNKNMRAQLLARGIDVVTVIRRREPSGGDAEPLQLVLSTVTFWVAKFHYTRGNFERPGAAETAAELGFEERLIGGGLGFDAAKIRAMDFAALEARAAARLPEISEDDHLLQAVAEVVAEAGPWNVSMDMVARRSGLSKSGLYAHFKSRQDMLAQLFITEFDRLTRYVGECRELSAAPEEQFYLITIASAEYLRSRSSMLVALDWIRTRNLDLGVKPGPWVDRLFADIDLSETGMAGADPALIEHIVRWVVFLVINTMMWRRRIWGAEEVEGGGSKKTGCAAGAEDYADIPVENFRSLFRFMARGLEGL